LNRKAFLRELARGGCELHRHGKKHDLFINPANGRKAPVPRHNEVKDSLCELIRRQLGLV
jgi:mRNA interferase HicA